jgi:tetratricopeptide (TPR) repeat protein
MRVIWRFNPIKNSTCAAMLVGALIVSSFAMGCESSPMRTFRGARHYAAGTEALTQNDPDEAIAELEKAAVLIPHASEIQNHLGLAYWTDGRPQAAKIAFEMAVELDCENIAAQTNLERLMQSEGVATKATLEGSDHGG